MQRRICGRTSISERRETYLRVVAGSYTDRKNADAQLTELKKKGVKFWNIDMDQLRKAYKQEAKEKNFTFDPKWQAAVDQTIKEHPTKGE